MARAVSDYFGISLKCNFRRPFYSRSIKEYWRRWHITLGAWFRDYIYIPLGGNRRGLPVQIRNLLIVWLFTGLWHGANGTFIVFGLIHGFIMIFSLVCEKLLPGKKEVKRPLLRKWLEIVRTFLLVSFLFLIFRAPSLSVAWEMIRRLFDFRHFFVIKQASLAYRTFLSGLGGMPYLLITLVGLALLLRHDVLTEHGKDPLRCVSKLPKPIKYLLSMLTVLFLLFMINRSAGHFTYMQF